MRSVKKIKCEDRQGKLEIVAVLHDIRSVHNVGSMFRTADGAGIGKIYLTGITPAPVDRLGKLRTEFAKVALGAERSVPWERRPNITGTLRELKTQGYRICAVEQDPASRDYSLFHARTKGEKICLIMGNEVSGVPHRVLSLADTILEIPMRGEKESLNVGVAFGIVAFHIIHERLALTIKKGVSRGRRAQKVL